jgi:multiple sugar transport system permease protein
VSATTTTTAPQAVERKKRVAPAHVRRKKLLATMVNHTLLITLACIFLAPVLVLVLTAVMSDQQALTPKLWPSPFHWRNFLTAFDQVDLVLYLKNTFIYAFFSTVGTVLSCVPVAYALSRIQWRGRQVTFILVLATIMLPYQVTFIPLYVIFVHLGWVGSFKPLIVPSFFGDAYSIFLLRQFFLTIPQEMTDAARVDGANEFQIMMRVIVPMAKPAIAAVALFNFLYCWDDFFGPLLYVAQNPHNWTLAFALSQFQGQHHVNFNLLMAVSGIFMLPVIILFFVAQKAFIEGVNLTGIKG